MNWRRIIVIGIIVIIVLWLGITCMSKLGSGIGSTNSPEGTTRAVIMSLEGKDGTKVATYFTPIPGALMSQRVNSMFANFDKVDIQNLKVMLVLKEGSSARVQAVYDMILTQGGYINTEHCSKVVKLIQLDGKWFVNEVF
jgi:hypothetical protein